MAVEEPALRGAAEALARRGAVVAGSEEPPDCRPVPMVAANLAVLAGAVAATDHGWIGLHPYPDGSRRRMIALRRVARENIGTWLAPYLAQLLEFADERT